MATKREQVWVIFKSKGKEEANKLGLKLGIPEGQMKRVIRAMTEGTWKPPMKRGSKKSEGSPAKAKAPAKAAKAKAPAKAKPASKATAKKTKQAEKASAINKAVAAQKRVRLTYDKARKGTVVRPGEQVSTVKFDEPGSQKEEHIPNKLIVEA